MAINGQMIQGQWNQLRGLVQQRWGQLTEDDLQLLEGNVEQLVGRIQQKTGEGREAIEDFFSELIARGSSAADAAGQYAHQIGDRLHERYDNTQALVRHHPMETVVAAFGIGLVAGLIAGLTIRGR